METEDKSAGDNAGSGHPLPESEEARHDEIPESLEQAKSQGEDAREATQATPIAVTPEGIAYRSDAREKTRRFVPDQAGRQERGRSRIPDA